MARLGLSQQLRTNLAQQQLLLPKMLQSIEVLALPVGELDTWLRNAAEDNEALAVDEGSLGSVEPALPAGTRGTRADSDRHDQMLQNQPAPEASLAEQVEQQLALLDVDGELLDWVRLLVGSLDPAGYLPAADDALLALAEQIGLEPDEGMLRRALAVLRGLEPRGIGARNAIEALILQLDTDDPEYELLCQLLEEFLEDMARNKLPGVARSMGLSVPELQQLIARLGELDPRPVARLSSESAPGLHPDLVVERDGEQFQVRVEASGMPAVHIDEGVEELYRDRSNGKEVRAYLRNKLDRARWICDALEQRNKTLLSVALKVFDHQHAFLERGPSHLVPLRMNRLAEELGIHVSTVSRAVAGKYVQTPYGILPLRTFFQASAGGAQDGDSSGVARSGLRDEVSSIIRAEDPKAPLSDDDVVAALAERGLKVARRTVAKYRGELGIPSSYRRRAWN